MFPRVRSTTFLQMMPLCNYCGEIIFVHLHLSNLKRKINLIPPPPHKLFLIHHFGKESKEPKRCWM